MGRHLLFTNWRVTSGTLSIPNYEDVYSPMKAAQQEHKHTDRDTNVKERQRTELSKDIKTRIHVYETKVFSLLKIQSKPTQHPVLTP